MNDMIFFILGAVSMATSVIFFAWLFIDKVEIQRIENDPHETAFDCCEKRREVKPLD